MSVVLRGGKTQKNGNVLYVGCIRNIHPVLCGQLDAANHLFRMFTLRMV